MSSKSKNRDFLRKIVEDDLKSGKYSKIVTRFPPEPNGFPHIGHAKSIVINFGIARDYNGYCNLRMDDTNPTTEETKYVEAIKDAVEWLGFEWSGDVKFASDYFERLYEWAKELIKMKKAYVDSLSEEEIREYRGTITTPGKRSKFANRSVEENLLLFEQMKNGEFEDGTHVLRAKIDMSSPNMKMRDPLLYRIKRATHFRTKNRWAIYPMYDFAHPLSDYIEGVTHSFCTLEFENNRELYDWVIETLNLKPPRPYQYEFARLNMNYTVMSKRKLLELVEGGFVDGWDDPRMPTIAGLRRRGYTPESILNFCEQIGVAKANSIVDVSQLEFAIRDDLNLKVPRVMCVLDPLKVTIINYEGEEEIDAPYYPPDVPKEGSRKLPFSKEIYINRDDFSLNPPKGYFRLTPTQPVRLKYAYIISCEEVIKDKSGNVVEIKAKYYPESKSGQDRSKIRVKSAIQWVEAKSAKRVEVRVYDRLFRVENPTSVEDINPNSLKIIRDALIEPSVIENNEERFQFEREGYFFKDPIEYTKQNPVFNKIVSLKDSWAKKIKKENAKRDQQKQKAKNKIIKEKKSPTPNPPNSITPMTKAEEELFEKYKKSYKLSGQVATTLARDERLAKFFEETLQEFNSPIAVANMVANEVARELKRKEKIKFSPKDVAKLLKMVESGKISTKVAKDVFEEIIKTNKDPEEIVKEKNLTQISEPSILAPIIEKIISNNPKSVEKFKNGNEKILGFFIGEVLKATDAKANPKITKELILKYLKG